MTAHHAAADPTPLDGHPAPGDVLRDLVEQMPPGADTRAYAVALAHEYDVLDDCTDERLVRELATVRGIPENLVRLSVGMKPIPPTPACSCELRLRDWRGGYGRTTTTSDPTCPVHGGGAA